MISRLPKSFANAEQHRRALQELAKARLGEALGVNRAVGSVLTGTTPAFASDGAVIPRNGLSVGKLLQVRGYGRYSLAAGTIQIELLAGSVVLIDSGEVTLPFEADKAWVFKAQVHGLTTGETGSVQAFLELLDFNGVAVRAPAATVALNTRQQHALRLRLTFSDGDAGNTFTEQIFSVRDEGA
jgi:hypothetical protein